MQILSKYLDDSEEGRCFQVSLEETHRCVYLSYLSFVLLTNLVLILHKGPVLRVFPIVLI